MDPLRKVQRGQKLKGALSAAAWNQFIGNLKDSEGGAGGVSDAIDPANTALFVWGDDPTETLAAFSVLAYGDPLSYADPTVNPFITAMRPVFEAADPADAALPFAITLGPVNGTNAVKVAVSGLCPVLIDVSDAGHTRAQPIAADTDKLESCESGGVPIVWKESGTGDKWAVVLLDFAEASASSDPVWTRTAWQSGLTGYLGTLSAYPTIVACWDDGVGFAPYSITAATTGKFLFTASGYMHGTAQDDYVGIARFATAAPGTWLTNYDRLWYYQRLKCASGSIAPLQFTIPFDIDFEATTAGAAIPANSALYLVVIMATAGTPTAGVPVRISHGATTPLSSISGN